MIDQEVSSILSELVQNSALSVRHQWIIQNKFFNENDLVWYMPSFFIQALAENYYRVIGMTTVPKPPRLMGVEIRVGYEPCVVLTTKDRMAFTKPEYTIRGENLVVNKTEED